MFSFILPESSVCWVDIVTHVWGDLEVALQAWLW